MEDTRDIVVDVTLRPNDVYTPFSWNRGNLIRWVVAIVLCMIFADLYRNSRQALLSFDGGSSILAVIALLALLILLGLLVFPYLRVLAWYRKSPNAKKTWRYTLSDTGIAIKTDLTSSESQWAAYQKVFETSGCFLLYSSPYQAMYLPKRCFSAPNDIRRARELFSEKLQGKTTLRND